MTTTAHLPSIIQSHSFASPLESLKTEKFYPEEHEYEISKWLKLENEPLSLGLGSSFSSSEMPQNYSNYFSSPNTISYATSSTAPLHTFQPDFHSYSTSTYNFPITNANASQSNHMPSNQLTSATTNHSQFVSSNALHSQPYTYPPISTTPSQHFTQNYSTTSPSQFNQYQTPQYITPGQYATTQFAPATYSNHFNSTVQYPSYSQVPQYINQTQTPYPSQNIVPTLLQTPINNGVSQPAQTNSTTGVYQQPQYQYLYPQFHHPILKNQTEEASDDKKRKQVKPFVRRVRQTRPKVVEAKGAVQCKGRNRKKGTQCRNAALMEYIGPRPVYCAEHIELDPKSLYEKCKSSYQKDPGDNKGCKEVVLKEFGVCYKHYSDLIAQIIETRDYEKARRHSERIQELLNQLERDAAAAKKKDGDLYQRKNKLIPKFQEMKKTVAQALETLENCRQKDFAESLPTDLSQLPSSPPIMIPGIAVHIVEGLSSEDEDSLSSPISDDSLEGEFEQILN